MATANQDDMVRMARLALDTFAQQMAERGVRDPRQLEFLIRAFLSGMQTCAELGRNPVLVKAITKAGREALGEVS